jgi:hypothetical protein
VTGERFRCAFKSRRQRGRGRLWDRSWGDRCAAINGEAAIHPRL